ncbi:GtrA family protein [Streptoalloteichus hindustanus]|uniref:GtrA family protein n=1 Tax=Streptoalloteichus hindustanus TaxID=2017 RepID=UPI000936675E|nr:GtrA family protein [Streptoalloteichus hindustanus]
MSVADTVMSRIPPRLREVAYKHRELLKFAIVGGTTFVIDTAIFFLLKTTILSPKPVTAKVLATLVATIVSYILNREWSFRERGGRERHHEAALFFVLNGIGLALNAAPLWVSRYVFDLQEPDVSRLVQEIADFASAQIVGTLVAMVFRFWAYRKWVFPDENGRSRRGSVQEDATVEELGHS